LNNACSSSSRCGGAGIGPDRIGARVGTTFGYADVDM
jgi:hypothetical protein